MLYSVNTILKVCDQALATMNASFLIEEFDELVKGMLAELPDECNNAKDEAGEK